MLAAPMASDDKTTVTLALLVVHSLEAAIGTRTAITLSIDISARKRPDIILVVKIKYKWNLKEIRVFTKYSG
jgi:predicted thioesterase